MSNTDNIFVTQVTQQGTAQLTCTSIGNIIKVEGHSEECTSVIMAEQSQSQHGDIPEPVDSAWHRGSRPTGIFFP